MNNNQGRRRTRRVRQQRKQKNTQISRILLTICMMALVAVVSIGGTLAWLTASTETIVNTFKTSNVSVTLTETANALDGDDNNLTNAYQMVPGVDIAKNPTVNANGDVPYFIFVKAKVENWPTGTAADKITYSIGSDWKPVTGELNGLNQGETLYVKEMAQGGEAKNVAVITNNTVYVANTLTKEELAAMTDALPQLSFTAYVMQMAKDSENNFSAAEAWNTLNP